MYPPQRTFRPTPRYQITTPALNDRSNLPVRKQDLHELADAVRFNLAELAWL